jgi:hypothetical protein
MPGRLVVELLAATIQRKNEGIGSARCRACIWLLAALAIGVPLTIAIVYLSGGKL